MDEHAYAWANYLLGNDFFAAVLEITFGGLELQAKVDTNIALTGADLEFKINEKSAPLWQSIKISKGDKLTWGNPKSGVRAYFAAKNGFNTEELFGSKSVNLRENIGNKLAAGDELNCEENQQKIHSSTPPEYLPDYSSELILRLLPSYQFSQFSINQRDLFFNQNYTISTNNDRVGCRLNGAPMALSKENRISEGMSYGSVEIATDGLPIILLKDAPTMGGYAKIGTIFSLDLAKLAQKQPNTKLRFKLINISQAQAERREFDEFFKA
ncbi:MAG: biotin-dependent carboxyltransferase family protein [Candidatus Thioglobus sp.]|nr:biotin-dependent carboxyltransferase family protein [Candidatus Thioglobus sp.]